jgi:hypothetical protein
MKISPHPHVNNIGGNEQYCPSFLDFDSICFDTEIYQEINN